MQQQFQQRSAPIADASARRWRPAHPVVVVHRAGKQHVFVVRPWLTAMTVALFASLCAIIVGSSGYLYFRDDILARSVERYQDMEATYEERIAALRAKVDLVTSRQMIDQRAVENRVSELMARQEVLQARERKLTEALNRAKDAKAITPRTTTSRLPKHSSLSKPAISSTGGIRLGGLVGSSSPFVGKAPIRMAQVNDRLFDSVEATLRQTEQAQLAELSALTRNADMKAERLASILDKQGIRMPAGTGVGGPLIQLKSGNAFLNKINALDAALETLEAVRKAAKSLPHGSPTPGQQISSTFGTRKDPFTGSHAMHGGLDFRAATGTPVLATASGKITKAGRMGGYGKLVEIDHGGGITTRYAHLSRISVKPGQKIRRGMLIGKVGSTGRSTGPHLHYEVRRKGRVLNPIHYVRLEKHLEPYL